MSEIDFLSIAELGTRYRRKALSPVEVTRRALARIKALDGKLNAFITLLETEALAQAAAAERELAAGIDHGPLHGVPVAIKDLIAVGGAPTTFASRAGSPQHPTEDAALVRNLRKAGAVLIGKTNLLEYAYGAVHPEIGQTNNPGIQRAPPAAPAAAPRRGWPRASASGRSAPIRGDRSASRPPIAGWWG